MAMGALRPSPALRHHRSIMSERPVQHLSAEQFRKAGYALIDWLADYRGRVAELPVKSPLAPGEVRAQLPPAAPEEEPTT